MSVDSRDFSQSASVMLCYRIYLTVTVCHAGGTLLFIRQVMELMIILSARVGNPNWITDRIMNNVVKME